MKKVQFLLALDLVFFLVIIMFLVVQLAMKLQVVKIIHKKNYLINGIKLKNIQ